MLFVLMESALRSLALGTVIWIGMRALRIRNPHIELTAWSLVLAASLAMPLLMRIEVIEVPSRDFPLVLKTDIAIPLGAQKIDPVPAVRMDSAAVSDRHSPYYPIAWQSGISAFYLIVSGLLLVRLMVGVALTWRLTRKAQPITEAWATGADIRVSDAIGIPIAFGNIVMLPDTCFEWPAPKRRAVLSHELSHVAHHDYYLLLLASFHRAVMWFNPLSWWLLNRISELMETISDEAAISDLRDRHTYAEILLDVARAKSDAVTGVAMARPATIGRRIERILEETGVLKTLTWRGRALVAASLAPIAAMTACSITQGPQTVQSEMPGYTLFKQLPLSGKIDGIDEIHCDGDARCKTIRVVRDVDGAGGALELFQDARITSEMRASHWKIDGIDMAPGLFPADKPAMNAQLVRTDPSGKIVAVKTLDKPLADLDAVFLRSDQKPNFLLTVDYSAGTGDSGPVTVILDDAKPGLDFLRFIGPTSVPVLFPANQGTKTEMLPGFEDRVIGLLLDRGPTEILKDADGAKKITELLCTHDGYDDPKTKEFVYDPLSIHFVYHRIGSEWHRDATAGFEGCDG